MASAADDEMPAAELADLRARLISPGRIDALYDLGARIGSGAFGTVRFATERATGRRLVLKILHENAPGLPLNHAAAVRAIFQEVEVLRDVQACRNPNILSFVAAHEEPSSNPHRPRVVIASELCSGGELFDRIVARGCFSEREAASVIAKLARALQGLHSLGIVHRDLKPENVLLRDASADAEPVLSDLGLALVSGRRDPFEGQRVGTACYMPPEMLLRRECSPAADVWMLGCLAFVLLGGYAPFGQAANSDARGQAAVKRAIVGPAGVAFDATAWGSVSHDARQLVRAMLCKDPARRASMAQVLAHPWVTANFNTAQLPATLENLRAFNAQRRARAAAQAVLWGASAGLRSRVARLLQPAAGPGAAAAHASTGAGSVSAADGARAGVAVSPGPAERTEECARHGGTAGDSSSSAPGSTRDSNRGGERFASAPNLSLHLSSGSIGSVAGGSCDGISDSSSSLAGSAPFAAAGAPVVLASSAHNEAATATANAIVAAAAAGSVGPLGATVRLTGAASAAALPPTLTPAQLLTLQTTLSDLAKHSEFGALDYDQFCAGITAVLGLSASGAATAGLSASDGAGTATSATAAAAAGHETSLTAAPPAASGGVARARAGAVVEGAAPFPLALDRLFAAFDTDGSGFVEYGELVVGLAALHGPALSDDALHACFSMYDTDRDGFITFPELARLLQALNPVPPVAGSALVDPTESAGEAMALSGESSPRVSGTATAIPSPGAGSAGGGASAMPAVPSEAAAARSRADGALGDDARCLTGHKRSRAAANLLSNSLGCPALCPTHSGSELSPATLMSQVAAAPAAPTASSASAVAQAMEVDLHPRTTAQAASAGLIHAQSNCGGSDSAQQLAAAGAGAGAAIAHTVSLASIAALEGLFARVDINTDGRISAAEFTAAIRSDPALAGLLLQPLLRVPVAPAAAGAGSLTGRTPVE